MPGQWTKVDPKGAAVTIDYPHYEVHNGEMWICSVTSTALLNDGVLSLATNGAIGESAHFTFDAECGGDALAQIWEHTTATGYSTTGAQGTTQALAYNMNRSITDTFGVIKNCTTISSSGTLLAETFLPGGKGPQAGGGGAGTRPGLEFICDPTKWYIVSLTNKSGATKGAGLTVNFYT